MERKKISWITGDYFIDVDFLLVPYMKKKYADLFDIDWVVIRSKSSNIHIDESLPCDIITLKYGNKDPRVIFEYLKVFKKAKRNAEIIYSDFVGVPFYYPILLNYIKNIPIVHAAHNVKPYAVWDSFLTRGVRYVFSHNNHFQIFSKEQLEYAENTYPGRDYFYCPMTVKSYGEVRTDNYKIDSSKLNLLFFGNVVDNKRLDLLIEAIKELPIDVKNRIHLTVAGNNRNKERYTTLIANDPCISTYFKRIEDDEVPELFTKHDFLMLTYEAVAQSGPHMIACNYNLPVIASNISGFSERVIDGYNGFLFKVNDKESLKESIIRVINMTVEEYSVMKQNLSSYTEINHSVESVAKKYVEYFNRIISRK